MHCAVRGWEVGPYEATVPRTLVYPPCVKRDEILLAKGKYKSYKIFGLFCGRIESRMLQLPDSNRGTRS